MPMPPNVDPTATEAPSDPRAAGPRRRNPALLWLGLMALVAVGQVVVFYRGYVLDDMYIYMQYARNLSEGNGWVFSGSEPTYGFTSPLYALILAAIFHVLGPSAAVTKALSVIFAAAAVVVAGLLASRLTRDPAGRRALAVLGAWVLAVDFFFLKFAAAGLETSLAVLVVLMAMERAAGWLEKPTRGATAAVGVAASAAPLVRPEFYMLSTIVIGAMGLAAVADLRRGQRTRLLQAALVALACAIVNGAWLLYASSVFGSMVPNTVLAKTGMASVKDLVMAMAKVHVAGYGLAGLAFLAGTLVVVFRRPYRSVSNGKLVALLWAWILLAAAGYLATGSNASARYWLIWTALLAPGGAWGLLLIAGNLSQSRRLAAALGFGLLVVAQQSAIRLKIDYPWLEHYKSLLHDTEAYAGKWLAENAAPDSRVAAMDIGAIGYFSQREIIDFVGLVTPEALHASREGRIAQFIKNQRPDYVMISDHLMPLFLPEPPPHEIVFRHHHGGYRYANPEPHDVFLLRLNWPGR